MQLPNYTQVSNDFIEYGMSKYPAHVACIFIAISRKTIGWHKVTDKITYGQLCEMAGLSVNTLKKGLKMLIDDKWIIQTKQTKNPVKGIPHYSYDLNIDKTVSKEDTNNDKVSGNDTYLFDSVSKIDTQKTNKVSRIDTTKESTINKTLKKDPLYTECKNYYNTSIINLGYTQEKINQNIWKIDIQRVQFNNLIKRFTSIESFIEFIKKAISIDWYKDTGIPPTVLIKGFTNINMSQQQKTPQNTSNQMQCLDDSDIKAGIRK